MMIFFRRRILLLLIMLIKLTESDRKSKRTKEHKSRAPTYEIYSSDKLPSDVQVTTFLLKGEPKIFYYWSTISNGPLSTIITTCSSQIQWSMIFSENNTLANPSDKSVEETTNTKDTATKYFTAFNGLYVLRLTSHERDTYVHLYISTEAGGPQALQNSHHHRLRLQKRQRRKRLTIRWESSLVDPQGTDYCLTVNTKKNYKSLCSAQTEKFGILLPKTIQSLSVASQTVISWKPSVDTDGNLDKTSFPLITCVGRKTQYTISNLKQGQTYYFDLFATNRQTNLTYSFGSTSMKFDNRIKPIPVRDSKFAFANLKKLDGKAVFRYKVGKTSGNPLNIFIMPCGALIYAEIFLKDKIIAPRRRIEKFDNIVVSSPSEGARYHIKILAINREDVTKTSGVEIFVTSRPLSKIPLPALPSETTVEEYESLRKCDSVTVGWLPSPGSKTGHYCIVVKEGKIRETDNYGLINQCGLENRLRKSVDFALKYCKDISFNSTQQVITEKINYLRPGKSYIVQVTVKKPKGKTLSYDLVQVHTTPSCHRH